MIGWYQDYYFTYISSPYRFTSALRGLSKTESSLVWKALEDYEYETGDQFAVAISENPNTVLFMSIVIDNNSFYYEGRYYLID